MLFKLPGTHGLAGLCPAQVNCGLAAGLIVKVMIKTDNTMYLGPGQTHTTGDHGNAGFGNMSEASLYLMQQGQQTAGSFSVILYCLGYDSCVVNRWRVHTVVFTIQYCC